MQFNKSESDPKILVFSEMKISPPVYSDGDINQMILLRNPLFCFKVTKEDSMA